MPETSIKLTKDKIVEGLSALSITEIKEIMDILIQNKLFTPPSARQIYEEASMIVRKENLPPEVAEEAVRWARAKE